MIFHEGYEKMQLIITKSLIMLKFVEVMKKGEGGAARTANTNHCRVKFISPNP